MSTILIFVLTKEDLIKVVYKQGNSPAETLEEYPGCYLETKGGQVIIWHPNYTRPEVVVPTSRTIIKYIK